MSLKIHRRTIEIVTITATCTGCGTRSAAMREDSLLGHGWTLRADAELCPECASAHAAREAVREADEIRAMDSVVSTLAGQ